VWQAFDQRGDLDPYFRNCIYSFKWSEDSECSDDFNVKTWILKQKLNDASNYNKKIQGIPIVLKIGVLPKNKPLGNRLNQGFKDEDSREEVTNYVDILVQLCLFMFVVIGGKKYWVDQDAEEYEGVEVPPLVDPDHKLPKLVLVVQPHSNSIVVVVAAEHVDHHITVLLFSLFFLFCLFSHFRHFLLLQTLSL